MPKKPENLPINQNEVPHDDMLPSESHEIAPETLPGGSPATALLITAEQNAQLLEAGNILAAKQTAEIYRNNHEKELAEREIEEDELLTEAAEAIRQAMGSRATFLPKIWVKVEDPEAPDSYNIRNVSVDKEGGNYGMGVTSYYREQPDGKIEDLQKARKLSGGGHRRRAYRR